VKRRRLPPLLPQAPALQPHPLSQPLQPPLPASHFLTQGADHLATQSSSPTAALPGRAAPLHAPPPAPFPPAPAPAPAPRVRGSLRALFDSSDEEGGGGGGAGSTAGPPPQAPPLALPRALPQALAHLPAAAPPAQLPAALEGRLEGDGAPRKVSALERMRALEARWGGGAAPGGPPLPPP